MRQSAARARPVAGLARRRDLALGRLHDPRRHADGRGRAAATAQPAGGLAHALAEAEQTAAARAGAPRPPTAERRRDGRRAAGARGAAGGRAEAANAPAPPRPAARPRRPPPRPGSRRLDEQLAVVQPRSGRGRRPLGAGARGAGRAARPRRTARRGRSGPRGAVRGPGARDHGPRRARLPPREQRRDRAAPRAIVAERAGLGERARTPRGRVTDLAARPGEARPRTPRCEAAPGADRRPPGRGAGRAARRRSRASPRRRSARRRLGARRREADRAARAAEAALAAAREDAVRAEGGAQQADQPGAPSPNASWSGSAPIPALPDPPADRGRRPRTRPGGGSNACCKEREEMGPVNLRAELEADEVEKQIATIDAERAELATAIAKLRGSIGHLNREGRERLTRCSRKWTGISRRCSPACSAAGGRIWRWSVGRSAGGRAGDLRPAAGEEAGDAVAAFGRRAGADRAVADLRGVPLQSGAGLRAGRGGRAAGRRQCGPVLHPAGRHGARDRHPVPGGHPSSADHGADGPAVWRDDAGARRVATALGRSGGRRRWSSRRGWRRKRAADPSTREPALVGAQTAPILPNAEDYSIPPPRSAKADHPRFRYVPDRKTWVLCLRRA